MQKSFSSYLLITLKGMCMGAADIIPGVSGGTIAFISGIYHVLIHSLKSINHTALKLLFQGKLRQLWQHINGNFLLALFVGIFISLLSLARLVKYLLHAYPILVWAFFFGLIVASIIVIMKKLTRFRPKDIVILIVGVVIAYALTVLIPAESTSSYWFLFVCGLLAICAMILPGISGAFILLLLGKYSFVLQAVTDFNVVPLLIIAVGAVVGLISFSNLLSYLLDNFYSMTISFLIGIMIGSLNKVWPWKQVVSTFTDRHGELKPLVEKSVLPHTYQSVTGDNPMIFWTILLAVVGFLLVFLFERISISKQSSL